MKPIVSKRNHFRGAQELAEQLLARVPNELKHPNLGKWLTHCVEWVISDVASDFATGAQRGIEQVAQLLRDPEFNEHRRESRKKQLKQWREDQAKQEFERKERVAFPTKAQIDQDLKYFDNQIMYHKQRIAEYEQRILALHSKKPADEFEESTMKVTQ